MIGRAVALAGTSSDLGSGVQVFKPSGLSLFFVPTCSHMHSSLLLIPVRTNKQNKRVVCACVSWESLRSCTSICQSIHRDVHRKEPNLTARQVVFITSAPVALPIVCERELGIDHLSFLLPITRRVIDGAVKEASGRSYSISRPYAASGVRATKTCLCLWPPTASEKIKKNTESFSVLERKPGVPGYLGTQL